MQGITGKWPRMPSGVIVKILIVSLLAATLLPGIAAAQGYALTQGHYTPNSEITTLPSVQAIAIVQNPFGATATYGLDHLAAQYAMNPFSSPSFIPNFGEGGGNNPSKGTGCGGRNPARGDPIVLGTGTLIESETDFRAAGEMGLFFERLYSSKLLQPGLLGTGWTTNFDKRLRFKYDTGQLCEPRPGGQGCPSSGSSIAIWAVRPDARVIPFIYWQGGFQEVKQGSVARLVHTPGTGEDVLYTEDNMVEVYLHGQIQSEMNPHGIGWTYHYGGLNGTQLQKVVHTSGRQVKLSWSGDQLTLIEDPAGNIYQYTFEATTPITRRLTSVTPPGTPATTISYEYGSASDELYRLKQRKVNGAFHSQFSYDSAGRASQSERPNGIERHSFSYTTDSNGNISKAVETNPLGRITTFNFESNRVTSVRGQESSNCPATYKDREYDENGNESLVTDFNTNATKTIYNDKGQLLQEIKAFGTPASQTTNITWDTNVNRQKSITVEGHSKSEFSYYPDNRLATHKVTNISPNGVVNQARTTSYSYTKFANGMLRTAVVDGPIPGTGDSVTYTYNSYGDVVSVSDKTGGVTTYGSYNALGQPGRVTGPNGAITEYTYDARGRITATKAIVSGVTQTTSYTYDGASRLATVTTPDNVTLTREYDAAGRVLREYQNEAGGTFAVKRYTYNNASQVTSVKVQRTTAVVKPSGTPAVSISGGPSGNYTVSWSGSSGVENYQLQEKFNSGSWSTSSQGVSTSKEFSGRAEGTYEYRVRACNAEGCTSYSSEKSVEVVYPPTAAPSTFTVPATSNNGSFTINWSSVSGAARYELRQRKDGGSWSLIHNASGTSKSVSGLGNGSYEYRVRACNTGGCAVYTAIKTTVVTYPPSGAPTVTTPSTDPDGAFTITWTAVSATTSYRLEQRKDGGSWSQIYSGSSRSKAVSGLANGSYDYRARACNAGGCSGYSAIKTTVVASPPTGAPTLSVPGFVNSYGGASYTTSWSTVSGATRYELDQSLNGGNWQNAYNSSGTSKSFTVSSGSSGSASYRVRACNAGGCGPYSATNGVFWEHMGGCDPNTRICEEPRSVEPAPEDM